MGIKNFLFSLPIIRNFIKKDQQITQTVTKQTENFEVGHRAKSKNGKPYWIKMGFSSAKEIPLASRPIRCFGNFRPISNFKYKASSRLVSKGQI